jgi:membrane associated rhomboid family serine protease
MLEDRDYMRAAPSPPGQVFRLSVTVWLILINFAVYAVQLIFPLATAVAGRGGVYLENYLALYPPDLLHGQVWQLLTFQFLHAGPAHLLGNCLVLYMFGRPLEMELGRQRYLGLYLGAGVAGGLLQAACGLALPAHFGLPHTVGASAGVFGLVAAFAWLRWNEPLNLLIAFVLPVTLKAKWLLAVETVLAVFGMLRPDQIAHAAHLGGILAGVAFARLLQSDFWRPRRRRESHAWLRPFDPAHSEAPRPARTLRAAVAPPRRRSAEDEDFISREVDPILEKISAHGIQSLTEDEKRILETARHRMTVR